MAQPVIYRTPLAGRPPFATDEPDSVYQQQPSPTRRIRQPPPPNPNERSSAYNITLRTLPLVLVLTAVVKGTKSLRVYGQLRLTVTAYMHECQSHAILARCASSSSDLKLDAGYDQYLDGNSGPAQASENPFDDSKQLKPQPIPLAAPRPGYAAPVAALNLSRPARAATPEGRQPSPSTPEMSQAYPKPLTLVSRQNSPISGSFPHTPHQLQPPMTPIAPAFIRPSSAASNTRDVKFSPTQPILRGEKEETLLPKRGQGEDFWRRFSIVAHEEAPGKKRKTLDGGSRHSRWVWFTGMLLLIIIIAAIAFGVYKSHSDASSSSNTSVVTALGGSANEQGAGSSSVGASVIGSSTYLHVSPTNTVQRRQDIDDPVPTAPSVLDSIAVPVAHVPLPAHDADIDGARAVRALSRSHARHRRSHVNRTSH
ncbi:predicted protein [Postia placenta Mad-698-R]|nr:predicted protein [Postia placenta Mad-698-R]